ncbi:MAG: AgmX/PglI C-terminal domain-containing protein [Deltaproteobacteria bacterium]|nr:AgmX/PglI C-terminal domain-containing protein [Deltaproteobacteria bacterium]
MKSSKTEPAPPPFDSLAAGATIPCAPAGGCATIQPEPWEYAAVPSLPPAMATRLETLPRRRVPVGPVLLALGVVAFVGVGYRVLTSSSGARANVALGADVVAAAHPSHVFVDVNAIVVQPSGGEAHAVEPDARGRLERAAADAPVEATSAAVAPSVLPAGDLDLNGFSQARRPERPRAQPPALRTPGALVPARRARRAHAVRTRELVEGRSRRVSQVRTELDAGAVAAVVSRQQHRLERCYEHALTRAGVGRAQVLRLVVRINPEGQVSSAEVRGANLPALGRCLEGVARGWAFPASRSGAEVPIPLRFTPQALPSA